MTTQSTLPASRRRVLIRALLVLDVIAALFAPMYWWASGSAGLTIGLYLAVGLLLTASVAVMFALDEPEA